MRLVFLALYAFSEFSESITCVFSMGIWSSNPTLTAIPSKISGVVLFCHLNVTFDLALFYWKNKLHRG